MAFGVDDDEIEKGDRPDDEEENHNLPDRFDYGHESLRISENPLVQDSFFTRDRDFNYRSDKLLVGEYADGSGYFWLDVAEAFRMIFFAPTRSGKSFAIQRIVSTAFKSGYDLAVLPDVKNEFRTMGDGPIQEKFRTKEAGASENEAHIHPEEEASGLRTQAYRPTFFMEKDNGSLPEGNKYCSIDLADLEKADFKTLINYDGMTPTQQDMFESLYYDIEDGEMDNLDDLIGAVETMDMNRGTKRVLTQKFRNLKETDFFNSQYTLNPSEVIEKGRIPILNMQKFDSFGRDGSGMPQAMVSIWLRDIVNSRRDGDIDETIVVTDETARWIPASGNPSCKQEFVESVDVDTGEGINYIFATQRPGSVPNDLISQCRYICIPWNLDTEDFKFVIRKAGIAKNAQTAFNTASRIKGNMGRFEWLVIDQMRSRYDKIKFMAPLCFHKETEH